TPCLPRRNLLPSHLRDILPRPLSPSACLLAPHKPQRRHNTMYSKDPDGSKNAQNGEGTSPQSAAKPTTGRATGSRKVTEARPTAQRAKLDAQSETRRRTAEAAAKTKPSPATGKRERERPGSRRGTTIEHAIAD